MAGRVISLLYGIFSYIIFLTSFLYAIGFVGDMFVPRTINVGLKADSILQALLIDLLLLGLFAVQHSGMARQGFKNWLTRIIPSHMERNTYVLLSSLVLLLLFWFWHPLPQVIWSFESPVGYYFFTGLFWLGWLIVLVSTFLIDHFNLFGLRQAWSHFKEERIPPIEFREAGLYKYVRHPIMLGFIIAFWATPYMTVGHLIFSIATTAYIFIGIYFEEKELISKHGEKYREYRKRVRMLIPIPKK